MEDLLVREQAAEHNVLTLLQRTDVPIEDVLHAFHYYRQAASEYIFADFEHAGRSELHLWQAHNAGKKYFHKELSRIRKQPERVVEIRHVTKLFMQFIKQGERHYRAYITHLNNACGGIPELESIALKERADSTGESQPLANFQIAKDPARESSHRALIYAGDLCRYRASEKLDKVPDFGPALGYYRLAAAVVPSSGLGHHQQAVVFLEQRDHLRAIYHLYRAICVPDPHPIAASNLNKEFEKTNAAWEKGELIQKGAPNSPDAPKRALVGWFVRLHSMCYQAKPFTGYQELEREVLGQLVNLITQPSLQSTITRMIVVNIAAQATAGERFQDLAKRELPTDEIAQSFLHYFRFNIKTFTALLQVFYSDLQKLLLNVPAQDGDLSDKLTPAGRRLLPYLRIYNGWLVINARMISGLATDDVVGRAVGDFWPMYARAIDLVAQAFPIWDLEERLEQVSCGKYLMEEDDETLKFTPVDEPETSHSTWYDMQTRTHKPRSGEENVVRGSTDDEMLYRVYNFLETGLDLANDNPHAPIGMAGTRVYCYSPDTLDSLTVRPIEYQTAPIAPPSNAIQQQPVPFTYAAAAANGHARQGRAVAAPRKTSATQPQSRDAQLVRMVEDLVDESDPKDPVTPPQPPASTPAIVTIGDASYGMQDSVQDLDQTLSKYGKQSRAAAAKSWRPGPGVTVTPPAVRHVNMARPLSGNQERMQSVSKLWNERPNPAGAFGSPVPGAAPGHSRVNSASSIRSRNSLDQVDTWGSAESAPRTLPDSVVPQTVYADYSSIDQAGMASPLLFGAGGSVWSSLPATNAVRNVSPSYGQGG
ncbi:hypothetical protein DOTSEDRAFT_21214 [Dothistroma septosporum NZE10]|uniref:DNA/RNA-binding domain-containing protein n=1 Tax=Dothistroma septosporum (strain NZE10 / CBS 128990) TaxID=675120 RepID=N1PWQ8_DOTSN|nr:hypothetical protein DOTSEDRAFT_21214 [Dothistroma septosporum NZE10]